MEEHELKAGLYVRKNALTDVQDSTHKLRLSLGEQPSNIGALFCSIGAVIIHMCIYGVRGVGREEIPAKGSICWSIK